MSDISTTYVEHLREKPSLPPTPSSTSPNFSFSSPKSFGSREDESTRCSRARTHSRPSSSHLDRPKHIGVNLTEVTPLISAGGSGSAGYAATQIPTPSRPGTHGPSSKVDVCVIPQSHLHSHHPHGHHQHQHLGHGHDHHNKHAHPSNRSHLPTLLIPDHHSTAHIPIPITIEVLNNSPRICRLGLSDYHGHGHGHSHPHPHSHPHAQHGRSRSRPHTPNWEHRHECERGQSVGGHEHGRRSQESQTRDHGDDSGSGAGHDQPQECETHPKVGRRRQVVGILVRILHLSL